MNGKHSVEKIGGTSMAATATLFDNVLIAGRKGADLYNRIFVVSAYAGMTDLLLEHKKSGEPGVYARFVADDGADGWRHAIETVRTAMHVPLDSYFYDSDGGGPYHGSEPNLMPFYQEVAKTTDLRVLVYNGDTDPSINSFEAANCARSPPPLLPRRSRTSSRTTACARASRLEPRPAFARRDLAPRVHADSDVAAVDA